MALEGVISTVAGEILKLIGSQALECFGMMWGLKDDLDDFKSKVLTIQSVLRDAEERQMKGNDHRLNNWLEKLGDVLYDIEDVLDEICIEPARREVMIKGKFAKQVRIFFSNSNQLAFNYRMACQLKEIRARLDRISKEKDEFNFQKNADQTRIQIVLSHPTETQWETHSSLPWEKVIGRDDEMSTLKKLLLSEDVTVKANISFIGIVGMGGIGKTTLAKALYNDIQVEVYFGPRIWIWVSDQFYRNTILKKIIESATGIKPQEEGMEALKTKLQKVIEGKKYLLVMDDVWNEKENEWEELKSLLMVGAKGSKILITKRDNFKVVPEIKMVTLEDLPDDRSWVLFKEVAFKEKNLESIDSKLIELGQEISKKCGGIPIVLSHIGRSLYGNTSEAEWEYVKNNIEPLSVTHEQDHVLSRLKLSYYHLPPNLKQCFAYTSLFPKGYELTSNELIRQWMAQGFIKSSNGRKSMEDIGKEYLKELCWRFFCEISSGFYGFEDIVYMHDVMRDLAREVAGKKLYVRGDPNNEFVVSEQTRHISFNYAIKSWDENVISQLRQAKGLRTFILFSLNYCEKNQMDESMLDKLFSNFPRLRVLGRRNSGAPKVVSKSIKRLRHLRYLDLSINDGMEPLSNSIIGLQNLQTLNLTPHFDQLKELPREICNLVNLRHLGFYSLDKSFHMPEGLKKLRYLQTLSLFVLDCKDFNKLREELNEFHCFIEELRIKSLEQLRSNPSQVNSVNLKNRKGFRYLILKWKLGEDEYEGKGEGEGDETILEGLEPHPNVEWLRIKGYCGVGLPNWLSTSHLKYLIGIEIKHCRRLQHLNHLCYLHTLKFLRLKGLRSLMSLSKWIGGITSLKELDIEGCLKLKSLPEEMRQLKSLERLHIQDCPKLENKCKQGGEDWPNISHVPQFSYENSFDHPGFSELSPDYRDDEDDEDDEDENNKKNGKMKDCITNIKSFFLTCGLASSSKLDVGRK